MKTKRLFFGVGLTTLVLALTGCVTSEDDLLSEKENDSGMKVKAQFNISIPQTIGKKTTRTTPDIVQFDEKIENFRGIKNIYLLPYIKGNNSSVADLTSKGTIVLRSMLKPTLNTNLTANTIPGAELVANSNSVLFGDVDLTVNTDYFLFYGEAIDNANDNKFKKGSLSVMNGSAALASYADNPSITPSDLTFCLESIGKTTADDTKETNILTYLNSIAQAKDATSNKYWRETDNLDLLILYNKFTGMQAGSSLNLQAAIKDLYFTLKGNTKPIAVAVCTAINNSEYVTIDETNKTLTFKDVITGYPELLPDGAAVLTFDGTSTYQFSYISGDYKGYITTTSGETTTVSEISLDVAAIDRYVYPASLYYWTGTPIKTSATSQADNYDATKNWSTILSGYEGGNTIISTTRSVALENEVNYGVARFDVKVSAITTGSETTIKDAKDNNVKIGDLALTGVLVGQQRNVDWEFKAKGNSYEYIIYDNIVQSCGSAFTLTKDAFSSITNTQTNQNYDHILVLQTKKYEKGEGNAYTGDQKVRVVLEFVNNGDEFTGKDGIVPNGCKFYLVGELDMTKVTDANKKSDYIFEQDHITTAQFSVKNLSKAIRVIPDLRNPEIELGLSVNLNWETGNTFEHTFE